MESGNVRVASIESEMRQSYLDYAMSVIVAARPAGCARRLQAGSPSRAVRHAPDGHALEHPLPQERRYRWRGDQELAPAQRHRRLRYPRPDGAEISACAIPWWTARATSDRSMATRPRPCATPKPGWRHRRRAAGGYRQGHRRRVSELRCVDDAADRAAGATAKPPGQWQCRDRGRHGDQHPSP